MTIFAHSLENAPEQDWEPLSHHLCEVGGNASRFANRFGASTAALAMGLLHDIGKCSKVYQIYIRHPFNKNGPKGPDHSTAGAREAVQLYGPQFGRLLAFGIAGHHSGLMDGMGHTGSTLNTRLNQKIIEDYSGWKIHVQNLPSLQDVIRTWQPPAANSQAPGFEYAFWARMMFSCLVDADFIATEAFYARSRGEEPPDRGGEITPHHVELVRQYMAGHRQSDTEVNRLRSGILDHANGKAALKPGLFTLTVPTGGGKTLTSLSFAMEHAQHHGLRRIVYVIPFTSIIEQTAAVFRDDVGLGDAVLEHHSSFDWDKARPESDDSEGEGAAGLAKMRRDVENWDAPIIVTTAVQFFESLFASRTSQSRKLHNLAGSVIILDEVQSTPLHLLRPCMAVIDELARNYGASIVLCTATQPALRRQDGALRKRDDTPYGLDIPDERELAPDPRELYRKLRRVKVSWRKEPVSDSDIAARFAEQPQMLCIVNSRAHARSLFEILREQGQEGAVHLTTLMCAQHRREVLAKARNNLKEKKPVRLVATSLIEAGVDISFPEVWREAAGLASLAQAAGRCNRSGELGELGKAFGQAVLFEPADHKIPLAIDAFYTPARPVLRKGWDDPLGLDAVLHYYQGLYGRTQEANLDAARLDGAPYPILTAIDNGKRKFEFPFATIARAFRLIDDTMDPIIIPLNDDARVAIQSIEHAPFPPAHARRKLQQFVVPVPSRVRSAMLASSAVRCLRKEEYGDRFVVLENMALYDSDLGLRLDDPTWRASEDNVF